MPEITLKNVTKRFGKFVAVEHLNLSIADGDFVTLLGPSGCGKTTTLRMIAGLETPSEGEIIIAGKTVFSSERGIDVPPDKRNVGFLFQNYALWPHMTVEQNIGFGLENLKWERSRIKARVAELLKTLRIEAFGSRYPAELSGGQQQRVAIARTLATGPKVLLMDEPLSNLDAKLRTEMRTELKRLHMETDSTFVYVTHDQLEAMTLSTRTCLMKDGLLQQYAPPLEVYRDPVSIFAADFVGSPTMNFIEGVGRTANLDEIAIEVPGMRMLFTPLSGGVALREGQKVIVGIRPEYISVSARETGSAAAKGATTGSVKGATTGAGKARVYSTLPSGMETILRLDAEGTALTAVVFGAIDFEYNSQVLFEITGDRCILFDADSGTRLASGRIALVGA